MQSEKKAHRIELRGLIAILVSPLKMQKERNLHKRKPPKQAQETDESADKKTNDEGLVWQLNQQTALGQRRQEIGQSIFRKAAKRVFILVIALVVVYVYKQYTQDPINVFASARDHLIKVQISRPCSVQDYRLDAQQFSSCVPNRCGRVVTDALVTHQEADHLLSLAQQGFALTQSNGSASILGNVLQINLFVLIWNNLH